MARGCATLRTPSPGHPALRASIWIGRWSLCTTWATPVGAIPNSTKACPSVSFRRGPPCSAPCREPEGVPAAAPGPIDPPLHGPAIEALTTSIEQAFTVEELEELVLFTFSEGLFTVYVPEG